MKTNEMVERWREMVTSYTTAGRPKMADLAKQTADRLEMLEKALDEVRERCRIYIGPLNLVFFDSYGNSDMESHPNLVAWLKERETRGEE